jgi:hypothetical protein
MVNFGEVGRICLNREIRGVCQGCLWWEWDSRLQRCSNSQYHVCPAYREMLFKVNAAARLQVELRPSDAGSGDQPVLAGWEAGIWSHKPG